MDCNKCGAAVPFLFHLKTPALDRYGCTQWSSSRVCCDRPICGRCLGGMRKFDPCPMCEANVTSFAGELPP